MIEHGPLFRESPMWIVKGSIDLDALMVMRPGGIVQMDYPPVFISAREWFEPIEDEL